MDQESGEVREKNLRDGDVAGGLRDLTLRVDKIEDVLKRRQEEKKNIVVEEEVVAKPREKGFLEKLAEVDLAEEVRRLRAMVECIEASMPYETRQTMEYLRTGKVQPNENGKSQLNATGQMQSTGTMPHAEATMMAPQQPDIQVSMTRNVDIRLETENQLERFKQSNDKELQSVMKVLKTHERNIGSMDAKILDMWRRLPKVLALLEPLQAQLEMTNSETGALSLIDSTGGTKVDISPKHEANKGSETGLNRPPSLFQQFNRSLPAPQPLQGADADLKVAFKGGFAPVEGAAGTGEGGEPLKELGSLSGLIKFALQRTTDDIHAELREELLRFRAEFLKGLDLKANKTELAALFSRLDALGKKRDVLQDIMLKSRDRSLSPKAERAADTRKDDPPSPGKLPVANSPNLSDRKAGQTCHERCKEPTCPAAHKMTQSLSRLPALKTVQ